MKTYNIGDRVWLATHGMKSVKKACPVCYGKKEVKLILGNGDEMILLCSYCAPGYDPPLGYIKEYEYSADAEQVKITSISIERGEGRETINYYSSNSRMDNNNIFDTEAEALVRSAVLARTYTHEQENRAASIKKSEWRSYSWNAGYHTEAANRMEKQIEYHRKMAVICKAKAKK